MPATKVTPAEVKNGYKFYVHKSADGTLNGGGDSKITFDTKLYDTGNNFDTATSRFTAPVAGFYEFKASVHVGANASGHNVQFRKNGNIVSLQQEIPSATGTLGMAGSMDIQLAAGDYMELFCWNSVGATRALLGGPIRTIFQGKMISEQ